jgi:MFS transporter, DHA2 family, methylenomycin A resistance protein
MAMILAPARLRLAHGSTLILLTMPLGVLIAQIDTSVVNLAVKEIGTRLGAGVTALQWVVDACNLVSRSGDARDRLRPRPQHRVR